MAQNNEQFEDNDALNKRDDSASKDSAAEMMAASVKLLTDVGVTQQEASEMVEAAVKSMREASISEDAAAEIVLMQARGLIGELKAAIASLKPEAARAALNALKGLPTMPGPIGAQIAAFVATGAATGSEVHVIEAESEINDVDVDVSVSVSKALFSKPSCQARVFKFASSEIKDYFNNELGKESYKGRTAKVENGKVISEETGEISGEELRGAFTAVNVAAAQGTEREELRKDLGLGTDVGKDEADNLRDSLDKLKKFKVNEVVTSKLPEAKQAEKIQSMEKRFEQAGKRLKEVENAQAAANTAESAIPYAPSFLHGALRQFKDGCDKHKEKCQKALAEELKEGVINESLMDGKEKDGVQRTAQQGVGTGKTGLPPEAMGKPTGGGVGAGR